ncbi:putative hydroquinone glucosyltransferase [Helianthus anomalus]
MKCFATIPTVNLVARNELFLCGNVLMTWTVVAVPKMLFSWVCIGDLKTQNALVKLVEHIICNSAYELEPAIFTTLPEILPIGSLLASNRLAKQTGYFWKEDPTCLTWLDQQPAHSVIYVAFGSFTLMDRNQFHELAIGLELTNRADRSCGLYALTWLAR